MGHGRALLGVHDEKQVIYFVDKIRKEKLNVRQVERLIQEFNQQKPSKEKPKREEDIFLKELFRESRNRFFKHWV